MMSIAAEFLSDIRQPWLAFSQYGRRLRAEADAQSGDRERLTLVGSCRSHVGAAEATAAKKAAICGLLSDRKILSFVQPVYIERLAPIIWHASSSNPTVDVLKNWCKVSCLRDTGLYVVRHSSVGAFVKAEVIPAGMAVAEAARRLGIARQTLHTFLSGKAKLSADMAARLERCFETTSSELLAMQAQIDGSTEVARQAVKNSAGYLTIGATDIENWSLAKRVSSRAALPLLIRRLQARC